MEIEEQELFLSSSRMKHRSPSPDGGAATEGESKRRKHHHHRRHHRHHRHFSKKDKEKEEGDVNGEEILEDGKGEGVSDENRMGVDGELEEGEILEVGEIKPEHANSTFSGEERSYSDKEFKALDSDSDALHKENKRTNARDLMNHESSVKHCETPSRKIEAVPRFGDANVNEGKSSMIVGESEVSKNTHSQKKYSITKDDDDACSSDLRSGTRSISPFSGASLCAMKHKDREVNNGITSNHSLGRNRNKEDVILSPSCRWYHRSVHHKDRSRSRDTDDDRGNRNDRPERHKVRSQPSDAEVDREPERVRSISNSRHEDREEKPVDYVREEEMDRGVHMGRERSASYSRHDRRESRHSDPDRERDLKKEHRRQRDRSSSISSRQDWDRGMRERDRGSVRDRDIEKPRDENKERYRERDRSRDMYRERERVIYGYDKDRSRIRDRELNLDTEREYGRQIARDRVHERNKQRDSRHSKYDERGPLRDRTRSKELAKEPNSAGHGSLEGKKESLREEDEEDYEERIEQQLAKQDEEDLEKIKEESRKRRQAILEKYKHQQLQKFVESPSDGDLRVEDKEPIQKDKQCELDTKSFVGQALIDAKQDPFDVYVSDPSFTVGKSPVHNGASTPERNNGGYGGLGAGTPKSERSEDMFCDDIFGESPVGIRKTGKGDGPQIEMSGLHDNWDDVEGYYSYRFGEVLDGRYEVIAAHGKGVFSTVVRAKDLKAGRGDPVEVAIKIIRSNEHMYKTGHEELKILARLASADPEDKRHCVRFLSSFKYRNHLCLVFESLHMNLREVLKKFGRNIGLKLTAVRAYAKQLFIALKHLKNCGVLHCDIKPDNMLVNEGKNVLKLCDFGNAMSTGKNEPTPYLVSRFYRAPEIILGLEYDHPLDMWSVGCCLYELYCGKVLFPGPSNNDMLRLHMELKGSFPKKMLKKGLFTHQHFDDDFNFHATGEDPVSGKTVTRLLQNIKPRDISAFISSSPGEDLKMVANFKDLLERIFVLDPDKRITVVQALSHPFITGK